jgi:hypothetical protein
LCKGVTTYLKTTLYPSYSGHGGARRAFGGSSTLEGKQWDLALHAWIQRLYEPTSKTVALRPSRPTPHRRRVELSFYKADMDRMGILPVESQLYCWSLKHSVCTEMDMLGIRYDAQRKTWVWCIIENKTGYRGDLLARQVKSAPYLRLPLPPRLNRKKAFIEYGNHVLNHHRLQVLATRHLFLSTYPWANQLPCEAYLCYIDRVHAPSHYGCRPIPHMELTWYRLDTSPLQSVVESL